MQGTPTHARSCVMDVTEDGTTRIERLRRGAAELGLRLETAQLERFLRYEAILLDWNQRLNLTAITAPTEVEVKHFLDSLTPIVALRSAAPEDAAAGRLLDVGAGAGFPGIPLAIAFPTLRVSLLEATGKKCRFLEHVVGELGLANVDVHCGRAEELGHDVRLRARFDFVIARAVAALPALAELTLPFARVSGRVIALKTLDVEDEVRQAAHALKVLGGRPATSLVVQVPGLREPRRLIIVEKVRATPSAYPRRPGIPAKTPLGIPAPKPASRSARPLDGAPSAQRLTSFRPRQPNAVLPDERVRDSGGS
jgi:16S rRNA (guanine527-N7)-methyltransferase